MAWARLDDGFHCHPDTLAVGLEANGLYCRGISYCAHHLTDGLLEDWWLATQTRKHTIIQKLVDRGLWERVDDPAGYRIVGYLDYNPTREHVLMERQKSSDRMKKLRGVR